MHENFKDNSYDIVKNRDVIEKNSSQTGHIGSSVIPIEGCLSTFCGFSDIFFQLFLLDKYFDLARNLAKDIDFSWFHVSVI